MPSWLTESLRLTLFPTGEPPLTASQWWHAVTGLEPEVREHQTRKGLIREVGPILDGSSNLELRRQSGRVDWFITPLVSLDQTLAGIPSIGDFPNTADLIPKFLNGWLASNLSVKRVAFGAILLRPVASHEEGYESLGKLLPLMRLDIDGARDFMLQINRPRQSSASPTIELNRISKWSVVAIRGFELASSADQVSIKESRAAMYANRLELDINTPAHAEGPLTDIKSLTEELIELAVEMSSKGDVR